MADTHTFEEKKVNPATAYGHPEEVLNDAALTRDQKIEILREWHYDATSLQTSADENMTGGEPDRLQSVSNALLKLGVSATAEVDPHAPQKESVLRRGLTAVGQHISRAAQALRVKSDEVQRRE